MLNTMPNYAEQDARISHYARHHTVPVITVLAWFLEKCCVNSILLEVPPPVVLEKGGVPVVLLAGVPRVVLQDTGVPRVLSPVRVRLTQRL